MSTITVDLPETMPSEDGTNYRVFLCDLDFPRLRGVLQRLHAFPVWRMMHHSTLVLLKRNTVTVSIGDDIGVFVVYDIHPMHEASVDFYFWDCGMHGRHGLILSLMRWACKSFGLVKLNIYIPHFAYAAQDRLDKMGLRCEGKRLRWKRDDRGWIHLVQFGVLEEELTLKAIKHGKVTPVENG